MLEWSGDGGEVWWGWMGVKGFSQSQYHASSRVVADVCRPLSKRLTGLPSEPKRTDLDCIVCKKKKKEKESKALYRRRGRMSSH